MNSGRQRRQTGQIGRTSHCRWTGHKQDVMVGEHTLSERDNAENKSEQDRRDGRDRLQEDKQRRRLMTQVSKNRDEILQIILLKLFFVGFIENSCNEDALQKVKLQTLHSSQQQENSFISFIHTQVTTDFMCDLFFLGISGFKTTRRELKAYTGCFFIGSFQRVFTLNLN